MPVVPSNDNSVKMTDINRSTQAYLKHNGRIEPVPNASSTLKRNNSYHQRLKKSYSECEYAANSSNNGQQSTTAARTTGAESAKWKSQSSSEPSSQQSAKPVATVKPGAVVAPVGSSDEFKRFHMLRNSYGGKSNLNVNSINESTIKTQVLLHQQKLKEYNRHAAELNNDSYSTCSSSQSDYQHPLYSHKHHRYRHHPQHPTQQQQHQQQYPVSAMVAANATLTRPGTTGSSSILKNKDTNSGGSAKNSLRRGAGGLSTLSLCSCDAETEIIPNPLRPLYQYSLDRKNPRQHTYTCEQNAQILLRLEKDRHRKYGSSGKLDEPFVEDMIPPPPPPLNRRPSYGYSCIPQPLANEVGDLSGIHQPLQQPSVSLANDLTSTVTGNSGIIHNCSSNQPDLFNFASTAGNKGNAIGTHTQQYPANCFGTSDYASTLKSTLRNKTTNLALTNGDNAPVGNDANKIKPKLKKSGSNFDVMNNGLFSDPNANDSVSGGNGTIPVKQFPPYYFDDNYLNHSLHQHFYYQNPEGRFPANSIKNDTEGQLYLFHHEPSTYIPNYDTLNLPSKYNTIGPSGSGDNSGHMTGGDFIGNSKYHHASSCNLNQFNSAKSNLISSHQHHFSNSISNFNFNPSQYFGTGLDSAPGATIIGGPGGLGVIGGDGFSSSISLNGGTPNKQQHTWKHRQCPSRGSSSTGSGSSKWDLPSRQWLAVTSILLIAGAAGVAVPFALKVSAEAPLEERLQVATQLLDTVPLIDGHNDLPWNIRKFLHNQLNEFRFDDDLKLVSPWSISAWSHTDLQRLKRGRIAAQFWAAYVPCEAQHKDAVQITLEQIDVIKRLTERYSPHLTACTSVYDIVEAHKNHQMCSLIGVEGGHSLGGSLGVLRIYYALGVRYMTLTSTCHTPWADSSNADAPKYDVKHGGLTTYGKTIIREMNRLGMIVDLSKSSVATMKDVLATSQAPVIFSHSSAHALCNSSRNVQDSVLGLVTKNRGLVMVNFYNKFLSCSDNATVQDAVAHINHIRQIAGIDHVGLGAGYDGINLTPAGLEDVSGYPRLFAELLGDGWTADELEKLAGRNLLRVLEEVEKVRENQRLSAVRPYEDIPMALRADEHFNCTTNS
ncbi:uncharacterized protein LOC131430028 isoform X2 [Malaya genurostris]|uniref:uncharacterized protein LOC131430028 isoform X2 n=1 Tax=Malaya genurostris TaxID=325434 RepID=UPI0026F3DD3F|nr:uncharacterized protein LOC131430028 isoform X2 [Malaya genurostris]